MAQLVSTDFAQLSNSSAALGRASPCPIWTSFKGIRNGIHGLGQLFLFELSVAHVQVNAPDHCRDLKFGGVPNARPRM